MKWKKWKKGIAVFLAGATLLSPISVAAENIFTGGTGIEGTMDPTVPGTDDGFGESGEGQEPEVTPGGSEGQQPGTGGGGGEDGKIPGEPQPGTDGGESDPSPTPQVEEGQENPEQPQTEGDSSSDSQEPQEGGNPNPQENVTPQEGLVPSDGSLAGETIKFVNLYWETDDLGELEAVFDGGRDEAAVQSLDRADRGVYETTIPAGDYSRISFRRAGSDVPMIRGVYNFYGVDMADAATETVAFVPDVNNTYYYDMGENPSYWGADPDYEVTDPDLPVTVLKEEPQIQTVSMGEENTQSEDVTLGEDDGNSSESGNPIPGDGSESGDTLPGDDSESGSTTPGEEDEQGDPAPEDGSETGSTTPGEEDEQGNPVPEDGSETGSTTPGEDSETDDPMPGEGSESGSTVPGDGSETGDPTPEDGSESNDPTAGDSPLEEPGLEEPESNLPTVTAPEVEEVNPELGNPKPGQMIYAIDLDQRENYLAGETATTYRVHIGFLVEGHKDIVDWEEDIIETGQGEMFTMYEKEPGLYTAPFPARAEKTKDNDVEELSKKYYSEIAFSLVSKDGTPSGQNKGSRHFNFRGTKPEEVGHPSDKFGYFEYYSGYTDTYYMNSNQNDSYWGAHPSNADQSLDTEVLYIDVEDYTENNVIADLDNMWLSWNHMPQEMSEESGYAAGKGWKISKTLPHENIRYFQFPKNSNATENTILTLKFKIKMKDPNGENPEELDLTKEYSYKFTLVPRSTRNRLKLDNIWEFNGQMWDSFEAGEGLETRTIFFNARGNQYEEVWVRVANEDGDYADKSEIEKWNIWTEEKQADDYIIELNSADGGKTTWLKLDKVRDSETKYNKKILFQLDIPGDYKTLQFRTKLDSKYYYTNQESLNEEVAYPCYFAFQTGLPSDAVPETPVTKPGITGYWSSVYSADIAGDQSVDIPTGQIEWEENVYYADSTFYDYYSDWESTGRKITEWEITNWNQTVDGSFVGLPGTNITMDKLWNRQSRSINTALESYYKAAIKNPKDSDLPAFYVGGNIPDQISLLTGETFWHRDHRANKWTGNDGGAQSGIVEDKLSKEGKPVLKSEKDPGVELPLFDEDFLRGNNALNTAVGNVYKNVKFPIQMDEKTGYWVYNSADVEDAMRLSYDVDEGYFMKRTGESIYFKGTNSTSLKVASFFPFNDKADFKISDDNDNIFNEKSKANYLFASKMEFPFSMTEDGHVYSQKDENGDGVIDEKDKLPITFEFQGDDDVWIFIDGILALDLGGIHDAVRGTIDLTNGKYDIKRALKDQITQSYDAPGIDAGNGKLSNELMAKLKQPGSHTLTMFYMERGLYESNMKLTFNFPRENRFTVEKEVDVESTRIEGEDDIFAGLLENMGGFNFNLSNLVTSGVTKPVEEASGYKRPEPVAKVLDLVTPSGKKANVEFIEKNAGTVVEAGTFVTVNQTSEVTGRIPDINTLLKIDPGETIDASAGDYLRLSMVNQGATDRNAQNLYISFVDVNKNRVGGYAGTLGYNGEANTFLTDEKSVIRINYKEMAGDRGFSWNSVDYMLIGIRRNNPETENASYKISYATFYKAMEENPPIGFFVDDTQISDYGSYASGILSPVDGAWYVKQNKKADGSYDKGISATTEEGTFNLADGQKAVFTDRFRTGSYIELKENREPKIFDTEWTLKEGGQDIPAKYLLASRNDITTIENPLSIITDEYPLTDREGDEVFDQRKEIIKSDWGNDNFKEPVGEKTILYRSYQDPDSSANIGTDLNVTVKNTLKRGSLTIIKKLSEESKDQDTGKYREGDFTFKIYYTNVAGRGLEKQLEEAANGQQYVVETVTVHTNDQGSGQVTVHNIPAGTKYWIEEVPANGTKLENIKLGDKALQNPHEDVEIIGEEDNDYSDAYVIGTAYASNQEVTFTNSVEPFYMDIQKIWKDGLKDNERSIKEVHIQLKRRVEGSQEWKVVTKDYFGETLSDVTGDYIVLNEDNNWRTQSTKALPVFEDSTQKRYIYQIEEMNHGNILQSYEVTYNEKREPDYKPSGDNEKSYLHVTYQAINTPAQLYMKKQWENPDDKGIPSRIQVKLLASDQYDPENSEAEVTWECYIKTSNPNHKCSDNCYITLSKAGGWSASKRNLYMDNEEGEPYYYKLGNERIFADGTWKDVTDEDSGCVAEYGSPVTLNTDQDATDQNAIATVSVTNKLTLGSIQIIKQGKDGNELLKGAEFKIERLKKKADSSEEWEVDTSWELKNGTTDDQGEILFTQLPHGTYRITETKAPGGYILDSKGIIVTIPGGTLAETYKNVTVKKDGENDPHITLTIKNSKLYELPSAGGPGIYRYMITGILLMSAAVFILYKRRDEEVLRR